MLFANLRDLLLRFLYGVDLLFEVLLRLLVILTSFESLDNRLNLFNQRVLRLHRVDKVLPPENALYSTQLAFEIQGEDLLGRLVDLLGVFGLRLAQFGRDVRHAAAKLCDEFAYLLLLRGEVATESPALAVLPGRGVVLPLARRRRGQCQRQAEEQGQTETESPVGLQTTQSQKLNATVDQETRSIHGFLSISILSATSPASILSAK